MSKLYKLFFCINSPYFCGRYKPLNGLYSSIEEYKECFPASYNLISAIGSIIKIPFFGYHDSDFHGYSSLELCSLAPRVPRSVARRPRR